MDKNTNALINEEYNYQDTNYYYLLKLDYYKPNTFNQLKDSPKAFHIQSYVEPDCQYYGNQFLSNNKLYNYL